MTEITPSDLMKFMTEFRDSMEKNIRNTNVNLEDKLEKMDLRLDEKIQKLNDKMENKLDKVDSEVKTIREKMNAKEEEAKSAEERMDARMMLIEKEMKRSTNIRRKTEELKVQEKDLADRPKANSICSDLPTKGLNIEEKKNKRFNRRTINTEDLVNENQVFLSTWAMEVEEQSQADAIRNKKMLEMIGKNREDDKEKNYNVRGDKDTEEIVPENWEKILEPEKKNIVTKVRKPVTVTRWFGDEDNDETSEESSCNEDDWNDVERRAKNLRKKKLSKEKKMRKVRETLKKAQSMIGIGEINKESIDYFEKECKSRHEARVQAVKEFLAYNLAYTDEELDRLDIVETREAANDNIVYIAINDTVEIKEIYFRKADSRNDTIVLRDYIPPQIHKRFMALNKICSARRMEDENMKTQIRFGNNDLEVFVKTRGTKEQYKLVKLKDFVGDLSTLPPFNHSIRWKINVEKPHRRKLDYTARKGAPPSMRNQWAQNPPRKNDLIRQLSTSDRDIPAKKHKQNYERELTEFGSKNITKGVEDEAEDENDDANDPEIEREAEDEHDAAELGDEQDEEL